MTVMATELPVKLVKYAPSSYYVHHHPTGLNLGQVYRRNNKWYARAALFEWGQPTGRTLACCGEFSTRREAVDEVWVQRSSYVDGLIAEMQHQAQIVEAARDAAKARGERVPAPGEDGYREWSRRILRAAGETYILICGERVAL